jgi:DNA-binding response OmpR family regulator
VKLTAKEFMLLQYLLQHRGRVLSRDLLLGDVWGYRYTGGTRARRTCTSAGFAKNCRSWLTRW